MKTVKNRRNFQAFYLQHIQCGIFEWSEILKVVAISFQEGSDINGTFTPSIEISISKTSKRFFDAQLFEGEHISEAGRVMDGRNARPRKMFILKEMGMYAILWFFV